MPATPATHDAFPTPTAAFAALTLTPPPPPIHLASALASAHRLSERAAAAQARMAERLEAAEAQRVREAQLIRSASSAAHDAGLRVGFTQGTHWGIVVGTACTLIGGALVLMGLVVMLGGRAPRMW